MILNSKASSKKSPSLKFLQNTSFRQPKRNLVICLYFWFSKYYSPYPHSLLCVITAWVNWNGKRQVNYSNSISGGNFSRWRGRVYNSKSDFLKHLTDFIREEIFLKLNHWTSSTLKKRFNELLQPRLPKWDYYPWNVNFGKYLVIFLLAWNYTCLPSTVYKFFTYWRLCHHYRK